MNEAPQLAVVVPTHNRADRLEGLVRALEGQTSAPPFEVIVVDDASTDDTWQELQRLATSSPLRLRPLRQDHNRGPAAARNRGWRASSAPLVAFTDDDCVPASGWLAALAHALLSADLVQGRTEPNPNEVHAAGPFSHTMRVQGENGLYETCNMAYRRQVLEQVDGFQETFEHPYGEDADLAWRAKEAGAVSAFCSPALVHHDIVTLPLTARMRNARRLDGAVQLLAAHPHLRSTLHRHAWFRRSHEAATYAAAALLASAAVGVTRPWAGAGLAAAGVAAYARVRTRQGSLGTSLPLVASRLPIALVEDLGQVLVLARASLRHRTLLL